MPKFSANRSIESADLINRAQEEIPSVLLLNEAIIIIIIIIIIIVYSHFVHKNIITNQVKIGQ